MSSTPPSYDVIVVGGGLVGAATTDALARRGQRVLLVEQFAPGHTNGSSHGDGRIIRFAYPEAIYVQMSMLAYPAWDDLAARAGELFVQITGGWDCGPADSPELADVENNFRTFSIPYERLSAAESNRRFPQFHLDEGSEAIYQAGAGVVFATKAVLALWQQACAAGAETLTGQRIERVEVKDGLVSLYSASGGRWVAPRLVVAAGGWSRQLLAGLGLDLPLQVTQEQVAYFLPIDEVDHRAGQMPIFIDYHHERPFYGLPQIDIPGVKVGWHHAGPEINPDHRLPWSDENLAGVRQFVAKRFPHLSTTPGEQVTCLYTNTPDYHFILDRHPDYPNVVIGTGFSGHGFKFGPVLGQILAALALDEPPPLPLDTFAISRFAQRELLVPRTGA